MQYMFESFNFWEYDEKYIKENIYDLSGWKVNNVINMTGMFKDISISTLMTRPILIIKNWNVSNVLFMNYMFANTVYSEDLSNWNTQKILYEPTNFGPDSITRPKWGAKYIDKNNLKILIQEWLTNNELFELRVRDINTREKINEISEWDVSNITNFDNLFNFNEHDYSNQSVLTNIEFKDYLKIVNNYDDLNDTNLGYYKIILLDLNTDINILENRD